MVLRRAVSCCTTCASIAASASGMCMTLAPTGNAICVSKHSRPWHGDGSIRGMSTKRVKFQMALT